MYWSTTHPGGRHWSGLSADYLPKGKACTIHWFIRRIHLLQSHGRWHLLCHNKGRSCQTWGRLWEGSSSNTISSLSGPRAVYGRDRCDIIDCPKPIPFIPVYSSVLSSESAYSNRMHEVRRRSSSAVVEAWRRLVGLTVGGNDELISTSRWWLDQLPIQKEGMSLIIIIDRYPPRRKAYCPIGESTTFWL